MYELTAWSIFDAIVNTTISITFLVLLRRIGSSHTGGSRQRRGFLRMLTSVSWILGLECSLIIFANILVRVDQSLDPQWTTLYVGEALRMRLFVAFLQRLNRMLRNKAAAPPAATTVAQSQIGTATVSGIHSGGSGSLLSTMFATIRVRWKSVSTADRISVRLQHSQSGGEGSNPHAHVQRQAIGQAKGSPLNGSREVYQLGFGRAAMMSAVQTRSGSNNSLGKAGTATGGSNTSLNNKLGGSNGNLTVRTPSPLNPHKKGASFRQSGDAINGQIAASALLTSPLSASPIQARNGTDSVRVLLISHLPDMHVHVTKPP
ncbi:hypothetical protein BCR44DRAFT_1431931 [Catenaria anguillulae PL171]|uniref:Uncharacterized protein n=1 Tax=Catenaria anguillulae PL171 TaxID=765915 RepID=A0A1Y2HQN5_9FUNG|nr:hypothetical protein BCR44DRAFT_1431931 [Catenaria anguillulae PL171]